MLDLAVLSHSFDIFVNAWSNIVAYDLLQDAKVTNDILLDEFGYSHSHYFLEWCYFHLMKYLVATRIQMYPFKGKCLGSMKPSPRGEDTSNLITQIKQLASSHATFAASPGTSSMICATSSLGNWAKR